MLRAFRIFVLSYFSIIAFGSLFIPRPVLAWYKHQTMMPTILKSSTERLKNQVFKTPCESENLAVLKKLIPELLLNDQTRVSQMAFSGKNCSVKPNISAYEIFMNESVDDPDLGMDQDLPETELYDPKKERRWMGGTTGLSSQGFRHMVFGGWKPSHPLQSFQIPLGAIGQAPARTQILAEKGKELIKDGHFAWGYRLVAWAMHYIQDICQPFHAVQVVSTKMIPWGDLLTWPPSVGFNNLVHDATRIVGNYHLAYETYILYQQEHSSIFDECLSSPEKYAEVTFDPEQLDPEHITLRTAEASLKIAKRLGPEVVSLFGDELKKPNYHLSTGQGTVNYNELSTRPDLKKTRDQIHRTTCITLANGALGTRKLIDWTLNSTGTH